MILRSILVFMGLFGSAMLAANPNFEEGKGAVMQVDRFPIQQSGHNNNGLLKIEIGDLPLPADFLNLHQTLIILPPKQYGGNHKHPRRELFISLSDHLEIHWVDETGSTHIHKMKEGDQLYLFDVKSFIPHAIVNTSQTTPAVLLELYEEPQYNAEPFPVIQ